MYHVPYEFHMVLLHLTFARNVTMRRLRTSLLASFLLSEEDLTTAFFTKKAWNSNQYGKKNIT